MRAGPARPLPQRVTLTAAGLVVLLDVLRVWTPSLITVFGRAAETPPELIGAYALACAVVPLVLAVLLPRAGAEPLALAVLVACRVALAVTDGGQPQLVLASIGTSAGLWWLVLRLSRDAAALAPGLAWGLFAACSVHATLGTYGAVWRRDVFGWGELALSIGVVLLFWPRGPAEEPWVPGRMAMWLVFPALLLEGVLFANAGRAGAVAGAVGLAAVVLGTGLGVLVLRVRVRRWTLAAAGVVLVAGTAAAALVEVRVDGVAGVSPGWVLPAYVLAPAAVVHLLDTAVRNGSAPADATTRSASRVLALGPVVWVALLFVYYAGYDLGYRADVVLVLVAILIALAGVRLRPAPPDPGAPPGTVVAIATAVAVAGALVGPLATVRPVAAAADPGNPRSVGVLAWNLRMGYGIDGRFDITAVAREIQDSGAEVVLLSEIDRGWLLNGGQDQLRILARQTGMHAAFGPAADQVWGDAILSRSPLRGVHSVPFGRHGAVTGAQALIATTRIDDVTVTVVSTHLQPGPGGTDDTVEQAEELATLMSRLRGSPGVVVAGGDLNTTPGSKAWQVLAATGFRDGLASARPLLTAPADDPVEQIDHLWVDPEAIVVGPRALRSDLSDHHGVFLQVVSAGG